MTARRTWKAAETAWGKALGGKRVPVSGRGRGDAPDIEHPLFSIEVKYGQRIVSERVKLALAQAQASAAKSGKTPLLCLEEPQKGKRENLRLVVMTLEDFQAFHVGSVPEEEADDLP